MSLNKITSSATKKEWMNINCNDLKATTMTISDLTAVDLTVSNLLETEDLIVNGVTQVGNFTSNGAIANLHGNKFPNGAVANAGDVLKNDGAGNLSWVAPSAVTGVFSGQWSPTIVPFNGGTDFGGSVFIYTLIGDVLTFSGDIAGNSPSTGAIFKIDFSLPLGKKPVGNFVYITGGCGDNTGTVSASNQICTRSDVGTSVNHASVTFSLTKGIDYSVAILNCIYTISGQCRVVDI
jgi:hypothetical protein